jgi:hypothetical protein
MTKPSTPGTSEPVDITSTGDRYETLLQIMEQQSARAARDRADEERELKRQRRRPSRVPPWATILLAIATLWIWLFPPAALRVDPPPPPPIEEETAALRFTMYLQVQRIRAFQEANDRLPVRLEEAGPPLPAVEYHRLSDDLYQLNGATDRVLLTYRSDLPLDEFVGAGADVVDVGRLR